MSFSKLIISKKETTSQNNLKDSEVFDPSCDLSSDLVYERKELYQIGEQFLEFIQEDYKRQLAILGGISVKLEDLEGLDREWGECPILLL